eukprot:UN04711
MLRKVALLALFCVIFFAAFAFAEETVVDNTAQLQQQLQQANSEIVKLNNQLTSFKNQIDELKKEQQKTLDLIKTQAAKQEEQLKEQTKVAEQLKAQTADLKKAQAAAVAPKDTGLEKTVAALRAQIQDIVVRLDKMAITAQIQTAVADAKDYYDKKVHPTVENAAQQAIKYTKKAQVFVQPYLGKTQSFASFIYHNIRQKISEFNPQLAAIYTAILAKLPPQVATKIPAEFRPVIISQLILATYWFATFILFALAWLIITLPIRLLACCCGSNKKKAQKQQQQQKAQVKK